MLLGYLTQKLIGVSFFPLRYGTLKIALTYFHMRAASMALEWALFRSGRIGAD